jgi:TRAP-type uncharacterized transport system substrate-binding protein
VPEPRIDRPITLHLYGDWGQANLHRVFCWLSQELVDRTAPGSRFAIWNGRGVADATRAVGRGEADVSLSVPVAFVPSALRGEDLYAGEPMPHLRALGRIPQNDRLIFCVDASFGVRTFEDLRRKRPPLRIATCWDDQENTIGYAVHRLLEAAGLPRAEIESWGGSFVEAERPNQVIEAMLEGRADAVFHEAVMAPWWRTLADSREVAFLSVEDAVLDALQERHGWPRGSLPAGYLRGMQDPLQTLDFSDFLLLVRADLPDDVAFLLTWCLCETTAALERVYRHIPPERAGITYPLDPAFMQQVPVPLHPGAAAYYDQWNSAQES